MFRLLGNPKRLCNGLTRRELLTAGALSAAGLTLADLLRCQETQAASAGQHPKSFGKAKSCILLYLWGSPSQLETFDPKPDAPLEIRGEVGGAISTRIPGVRIGELLPRVAQVVDRCCIVRSMSHPYPLHGIEMALTGIAKLGARFSDPRDLRSWPFFGSVVDYLDDQTAKGRLPQVPRNIALPWPFSSRRTGEVRRSGPYGGFLGPAYEPIWTEFEGQARADNIPITASFGGVTKTYRDPYSGITPVSKFVLSAGEQKVQSLTIDGLNRRRSLLDQLDEARHGFDQSARSQTFDRFQSMAFSLLTSPKLQAAIDVHKEPIRMRERYGLSLFGQSCLAARRLIEAGCKVVSVFWDEYESVNSAWDTHQDHFNRIKNQLCPNFDVAYSTLLLDLEERGLLDETLVMCISEHGRTPKIDISPGGGRDHYSRAYAAIFAGAGFAQGKVVGKTDAIAGDVTSTPFAPNEILSTMYHLLGIDHAAVLRDRFNRPLPVVEDGRVREELLG